MDDVRRNNLAELRSRHSWSQADVGQYLDKTALTICRHETHISTISPNMLAKYCRLYEVNVDQIYPDISEDT